MANKCIIAIAGRSGAGKDLITKAVANKLGIEVVCSYTDRPLRPDEVNGKEHIFLSPAEMDEKLTHPENICAYTKIGDTGFHYCVDTALLNSMKGDVIFYIIDPKGIEFLKNFKGNDCVYDIVPVVVSASDEIRRNRAIKRNGESVAYDKRTQDEKEMSDAFEHDPSNYEYRVVNNGEMQDAVAELERITKRICRDYARAQYARQQDPDDIPFKNGDYVDIRADIQFPLLEGESMQEALSRANRILCDVGQKCTVSLRTKNHSPIQEERESQMEEIER